MNKAILTIIGVCGITGSLLAQATVVLANYFNNSMDSTATSNGLVWTNNGCGGIGLWDGVQYNLSVAAWGGPSTDSLSLLGTWREDLVEAAGDWTGFDMGTFLCTFREPAIITIPGVAPHTRAWIKLQLWWSAGGPVLPTYEQAVAGGSFVGEALFRNLTGGGGDGQPRSPPWLLDGMPAIVLAPIPEPGVFAFAGLGLASLVIFCRRK